MILVPSRMSYRKAVKVKILSSHYVVLLFCTMKFQYFQLTGGRGMFFHIYTHTLYMCICVDI